MIIAHPADPLAEARAAEREADRSRLHARLTQSDAIRQEATERADYYQARARAWYDKAREGTQ